MAPHHVSIISGHRRSLSWRTCIAAVCGSAISVAAAITIAPWGDSITSQTDWRYPLIRAILADPHDFSFAVVGKYCNKGSDVPQDVRAYNCHTGNAMADIGDIGGDLPDVVAGKPDIILFMGGTNDLPKHSLSAICGDLTGVLSNTFAQLPNAIVLVSTIPPYFRGDDITSAEEVNAAIPGVVEAVRKKGFRAYAVNVGGTLTRSDLIDGVHINAQGGQKMAAAWFDLLLPYLIELQGDPTFVAASRIGRAARRTDAVRMISPSARATGNSSAFVVLPREVFDISGRAVRERIAYGGGVVIAVSGNSL